jgi:hypothetical protein
MEPEVIDPREQAIYEDYERKRKDYADFAASAPVQEKPGLWRTLAAIGAGAFGGSQYDKGGMQWGQNLAKEITEGPYQRKMNEHLKMLAAKRMGLDVAQEGMGVMGQISDRKQRAAIAKQTADDRKTIADNALYQKSQYAQGKYEQDLAKNTEGNYKVFSSRDEALKAQQSNPAYAQYELREDPVEVQGVGRRYYLAEPDTLRQGRKLESAQEIAARINSVIEQNPSLVKRGFTQVTAEKVTKVGAADLQNYFKEINDVLNLEAQIRGRAAGRGGGGRSSGEDPDTKQKRYEHNQVWANSRKNVASLTRQISALQNRIATTQDPAIKAALTENLSELQQNIAETLNSAYQEDPMMKPESMKQYEVVGGELKERGAAPKANSAPAAEGKKKMTVEIAKKFAAAAGGDRAKAEAMARAEGYTWE